MLFISVYTNTQKYSYYVPMLLKNDQIENITKTNELCQIYKL